MGGRRDAASAARAARRNPPMSGLRAVVCLRMRIVTVRPPFASDLCPTKDPTDRVRI